MIRYVLIVLVTVALLVLSMPAIDRAATLNTERQVDTTLAAIDDAATDLESNEEVTPAGHPDPQRVVDLTLPASTLTTEGVDHFELDPHENGGYTHARYVLADGTTREQTIDATIVWNDPDSTDATEIGGSSDQQLVFRLVETDDGDPIVVASYARV